MSRQFVGELGRKSGVSEGSAESVTNKIPQFTWHKFISRTSTAGSV